MDYNRIKQCDDSQGGSELLYVLPFVKYLESQIKVVDNFLTEFPLSSIFSIGAINISFDEDVTDSYEQKISFQVSKILSSDNFKDFAQRDFRIIIKDNNGNLRMLGLRTGLQGGFNKNTGANLADFNGYNFTYNTKEENTATFLTDLSLFEIKDNLQQLLQYTI